MAALERARERPLLAAAAVGVAAAGLLRALRSFLRHFAPGQDVPYASGWVPVLGHLPLLLKYMKDNNKLAAGRLALGVKKEQGLSLFRFCMFGTTITVVSDLEAIEEIISNDPQQYTKDFDAIPAFKTTKRLFGNGLFFASTDSEAWSLPHSILKAPFSIKGMRSLFPLMSEQADLLIKCLKREVGHGGVCHIDHWVTKMAFETIAVCATGTSFGSFDDDQDAPFIKALNGIMSGMGPMTKFPPWMWPIFFSKRLKLIYANGDIVRKTCLDIVAKRRANETSSATDRKDLLDMMLEDKDPKTGRSMSESMIVDNILTFLFAGQDSTAASMATVLCYLNACPRCKEKLLEELDRVVGRKGVLEWEHLSQLQYLDWCIKEALRLVPPAGGVVRTANGPQLLQKKWRIDGGTMVMIGIMAVHYDKSIWGEDVLAFRPERWENGPPHKHAFMPFASGPRACTGREFTLVEQKITIAKFLQHFDFKRPEKVEAESNYTTMKKEDQTMAPFIGMDVEFKTVSAFVGLFSAFQLFER